MKQKKKDADVTYWHPAFYADIQIELKDDADNLIFENEHQLGTKPMEIDVLIIKKESERPVKKNIGKIFKKHNIIEYKSPGDSLSVDDFYKIYGYTCFYKVDVPYVNSISIKELTITFVSEKYPRKLIHHLKTVKNYDIEMTEAGIYSVKGDIIPIQIIVTRKLSDGENLWLRSLTNNLKETEKAKKLIEDYLENTKNNLYQSVMETIMRANQKTFEEVNGMSDIIMEIVQEKFDRKLKEALEKELEKAKKEQLKKTKEEVTEQLTKQVTEEVTEQLTKRVTERVTEQVTERVTEQVTERVTEQVTQKTRLTERIRLIQKKHAKNKPLSVIADEMETEPEELLSIYNIIAKNPQKTVEEIYELVTC